MSLYNRKAIPAEDSLKFNRQYQLTMRSAFKILETGVSHGRNEGFVIRILRNFEYSNGRPYVLYVDMSMDEFDSIVDRADDIRYLLRNRINKTVFQNRNIHVWTQRPNKTAVDQRPMVCFRGTNGIRIYIIAGTFNRLMDRADDIYEASENCCY